MIVEELSVEESRPPPPEAAPPGRALEIHLHNAGAHEPDVTTLGAWLGDVARKSHIESIVVAADSLLRDLGFLAMLHQLPSLRVDSPRLTSLDGLGRGMVDGRLALRHAGAIQRASALRGAGLYHLAISGRVSATALADVLDCGRAVSLERTLDDHLAFPIRHQMESLTIRNSRCIDLDGSAWHCGPQRLVLQFLPRLRRVVCAASETADVFIQNCRGVDLAFLGELRQLASLTLAGPVTAAASIKMPIWPSLRTLRISRANASECLLSSVSGLERLRVSLLDGSERQHLALSMKFPGLVFDLGDRLVRGGAHFAQPR